MDPFRLGLNPDPQSLESCWLSSVDCIPFFRILLQREWSYIHSPKHDCASWPRVFSPRIASLFMSCPIFSEGPKAWMIFRSSLIHVFVCILGLLQKVLQTGCLKTVEMYSLIAWLLEVQKPGVGRATLLPEAVREGSCLASSSLCWPQVFLGLWQYHYQSQPASSHTACVCV